MPKITTSSEEILAAANAAIKRELSRINQTGIRPGFWAFHLAWPAMVVIYEKTIEFFEYKKHEILLKIKNGEEHEFSCKAELIIEQENNLEIIEINDLSAGDIVLKYSDWSESKILEFFQYLTLTRDYNSAITHAALVAEGKDIDDEREVYLVEMLGDGLSVKPVKEAGNGFCYLVFRINDPKIRSNLADSLRNKFVPDRPSSAGTHKVSVPSYEYHFYGAADTILSALHFGEIFIRSDRIYLNKSQTERLSIRSSFDGKKRIVCTDLVREKVNEAAIAVIGRPILVSSIPALMHCELSVKVDFKLIGRLCVKKPGVHDEL